MKEQLKYDGSLSMFVEKEHEINLNKAGFYKWLVERGLWGADDLYDEKFLLEEKNERERED